MTLVDAGPLIALINRNDPNHVACRDALLNRISPPLLTTWPCFTEAMYLVYRAAGFPGQQGLWKLWRDGRLTVHIATPDEIGRMDALMISYRDTPMDLADASLVAAAESLSMKSIFTLDSHFYAYRLSDGSALDVIP